MATNWLSKLLFVRFTNNLDTLQCGPSVTYIGGGGIQAHKFNAFCYNAILLRSISITRKIRLYPPSNIDIFFFLFLMRDLIECAEMII